MSDVRTCPTCGAKAKFKDENGDITYTAVTDEEAFKKINQLKKAMKKFKDKAEFLEKELAELRNQIK